MRFISVDLQNDFTSIGGICYRRRGSVYFVKDILIPYFIEKKLMVNEIISDYRQPRPGDAGDCCHPGEWGYESLIPEAIKNTDIWMKCMNSPIWTRDNIGISAKEPGFPYQDHKRFNDWLEKCMHGEKEVIIFGLTLDCCVLCTAQELAFRGYKVMLLKEATDTYSGSEQEKKYLFSNPPVLNWASVISWEEVVEKVG